MAKSVRRRNVKRNESRNQRINRLNRSRKKRKGRNSLLNKKKRRVSRRKSNRRSKSNRRVSRRSNIRRTVGGGGKVSSLARGASPPQRAQAYVAPSVPEPEPAVAAVAVAAPAVAVAAAAGALSDRLREAEDDPSKWPFHPEGDIYEVKRLHEGTEIIKYKSLSEDSKFLADVRDSVTPPVDQVMALIDMLDLRGLVEMLKLAPIQDDPLDPTGFGPGNLVHGSSLATATEPYWMMQSLRYNIDHARNMDRLKSIVNDPTCTLDRYESTGLRNGTYNSEEKDRVLEFLHCVSVRKEILGRIAKECSKYHGYKFLDYNASRVLTDYYERNDDMFDVKFMLWLTSHSLHKNRLYLYPDESQRRALELCK